MVPKGWDVCSLSDIALVTSGGTPSRTKSEYWDNGTIPWIRTTEVQNCILYPQDTQEYISEQGLKNSSAKLLPAGTVLLAMIGQGKTRGQVALLKFEATTNQNSAAIIFNDGQEPEFHFNFLLSQYENIRGVSNSAGQSNLSGSLVKAISVPVPPLSEQKKIAQILSTWDKAINTTELLLANSQQQKKALMQQLLTGKKRLLDKHGVRFSEEWKPTTLSKMGKIVSGGTPDTSTREFWDGGINWLTPTDVTALKSRFVLSTARTISDAGVKNSSATLLPAGSLMVCTRATIGTLAISKMATCTNQGFKNIVPSKKFDVNFIYYSLLYNTKELVRKASGSTFLELSKKDFENIELPCPLLEEQQKIATILSIADQEITTLQQKLAALKQEKKALMQQLLTGKRRVKVEAAA